MSLFPDKLQTLNQVVFVLYVVGQHFLWLFHYAGVFMPFYWYIHTHTHRKPNLYFITVICCQKFLEWVIIRLYVGPIPQAICIVLLRLFNRQQMCCCVWYFRKWLHTFIFKVLIYKITFNLNSLLKVMENTHWKKNSLIPPKEKTVVN